MFTLTVTRKLEFADIFRKYKILVDGVSIGKIGRGETIQLKMDSEPHTIQAKIDWCGSPTLNITETSDQTILVRSNLRGWRIIFIYYYILFNRHNYLELVISDNLNQNT